MVEAIVRFLVETVIDGLLVLIADGVRIIVRVMVPVVTFGRVKVAPVAGNTIVVRRWHGLHRLTDGTPVIGENLAVIAGLVFILLLVAATVVAIRAL